MMRALGLGVLVVAGAAAVVAGVYLWLGPAGALIVGGAGAIAAGLGIDDGTEPARESEADFG
jgi:hypothetical protein